MHHVLRTEYQALSSALIAVLYKVQTTTRTMARSKQHGQWASLSRVKNWLEDVSVTRKRPLAAAE
jgi:hypothetical protein